MLKKLQMVGSVVLLSGGAVVDTQAQMSEQQKQAMAFSCVHEQKPELSTDTQKLYLYAHYHDLHNMWSPKDGVWKVPCLIIVSQQPMVIIKPM